MNEIREKGIAKLNDLRLNVESTWSNGLKNAKSILQLKDVFKEVLDVLETAEEDLRLVFSTLVNTCKIIVDPAIKIIAQMIQDKPMDEQNEQKVGIQIVKYKLHLIYIFDNTEKINGEKHQTRQGPWPRHWEISTCSN